MLAQAIDNTIFFFLSFFKWTQKSCVCCQKQDSYLVGASIFGCSSLSDKDLEEFLRLKWDFLVLVSGPWLIRFYNENLPMRYRVLTSVMAYIGMSIYDKYTDKVENRQCGPFPWADGFVMGLGNHLKRGGECDINQGAFKFAANVCAVWGRARCTGWPCQRTPFREWLCIHYIFLLLCTD